MIKLNKYQISALSICALPIFGVIVAQLTKNYRFNQELRYIYLTGVVIVYLSWTTSFLLGIANSQNIVRNKNHKKPFKILWVTISLLPILYFIFMMLISKLNDPLKDDIILPSGEHISGEYK